MSFVASGAQMMSDLENILVKTMNGTPTKLKNVAELATGVEVRQGALVGQRRGEVAAAIVMILRGESSRAVIVRGKTKLEATNTTRRRHVKIYPYCDQTGLIDKPIKMVRTKLIEGATRRRPAGCCSRQHSRGAAGGLADSVVNAVRVHRHEMARLLRQPREPRRD